LPDGQFTFNCARDSRICRNWPPAKRMLPTRFAKSLLVRPRRRPRTSRMRTPTPPGEMGPVIQASPNRCPRSTINSVPEQPPPPPPPASMPDSRRRPRSPRRPPRRPFEDKRPAKTAKGIDFRAGSPTPRWSAHGVSTPRYKRLCDAADNSRPIRSCPCAARAEPWQDDSGPETPWLQSLICAPDKQMHGLSSSR